jgi:hypothetical protein
MSRRPIEELVDLESLSGEGRDPSPRAIREALPPGWVLDEDGKTARRDLRILAREGWVLALGLIIFGGATIVLFMETFPKGWKGVGRAGLLIVVVLVAGGFVGPLVTRALNRRAGH